MAKMLRICRTGSGKVYNSTELNAEDALENPEVLRKMFDKLLHSWFGCHVSTNKMKQESLNKVPTVEKLRQCDWVKNYFEVGLLKKKHIHTLVSLLMTSSQSGLLGQHV